MKYIAKYGSFLICLFFVCSLDAKDLDFTIRNQKLFFDIKSDYTYQYTETIEYEILSAEGIELLKQISYTYHPSCETFDLIEAYSLSPEGKKTTLPAEAIFTRTSQASENAPGFTTSLTTTFIFPNLHVGSRIFLSTRMTLFKPYLPGFSFVGKAPWACGADSIELSFKLPPQDVFYFKWAALGEGIKVQDTERQGSRFIKAVLKNFRPHDSETFMVFPKDYPPSFTASTYKTWAEIGAFYAKEELRNLPPLSCSPNSPAPTPKETKPSQKTKSPQSCKDSFSELKTLSNKIVGTKKGKEAARALYEWVCTHITYIAIYLDFKDGWLPHHPLSILQNKYGDCKDKALLLKTLLSFQGIKAYSALISAQPGFAPPLPGDYYFNHAILYLPDFDIFLDPTQNFASFGEIGPTLTDHLVVIATPEGKEMKTPPLKASQNLYNAHSTITLKQNGEIQGDYALETQGPSSTDLRGFFSLPFTTQEDFARTILVQTPEGGSGTIGLIQSPQDLSEPVRAKGHWVTPKGFRLGSSTFLPIPYGLDMRLALPFLRPYFTSHPRVFPFEVIAGTDHWTTVINLPKNTEAFHLPSGQLLDNIVGKYESSYTKSNGQIIVKRFFTLKKSLILPEEQKGFMDLLELLLMDLRQPIGIRKRDSIPRTVSQ